MTDRQLAPSKVTARWIESAVIIRALDEIADREQLTRTDVIKRAVRREITRSGTARTIEQTHTTPS